MTVERPSRRNILIFCVGLLKRVTGGAEDCLLVTFLFGTNSARVVGAAANIAPFSTSARLLFGTHV